MAENLGDTPLRVPPERASPAPTFLPAKDPDLTATTRVECWMATVGVLLSSLGFFCVCCGLSYRYLTVTLVGYVMAPIGIVIFVAFLFVYQTSRRIQCQAAATTAELPPWKYDPVNNEPGSTGQLPMVLVRTTNGKSATTESVMASAPDLIAGNMSRLRDSHV
ncbi:hypothetical protein HPB48_016856 [Haemaphysalis longicornis]|uniref:Uncharacterized protein n=1 Tax=Haemaphysalis longicornis TaxID=44386 RepID=A0A9J6FHD1_HAELO|nr:hypothetical protein HPB48_016856 [Haemaphysalis longicornis]